MNALSLLLQLSDSALPTGGFSHSFGFEQYIDRGDIHNASTFSAWLQMFVANQLTYTDALLIRMRYEGVDEHTLADLAHASTIPAQIRAAEVAMGRRIRAIGNDALEVPAVDIEIAHPALEFARVMMHYNIDMNDAITAHLTGTVASLTQNAVRGIPIGQSDGQRVITAAHAWIDAAVKNVAALAHNELGAVAPGLEIAQMQHEKLRARMFMS